MKTTGEFFCQFANRISSHFLSCMTNASGLAPFVFISRTADSWHSDCASGLNDTQLTTDSILFRPQRGRDDRENLRADERDQYSDRVLSMVPERLAVLKLSGITSTDLGEPKRVFTSIQMAGVRPRSVEEC
jgi:hypothetical protein